MIRILLDSIPKETFELLRQGLPAGVFEWSLTKSYDGFAEVVRQNRPHIAVLDRIHERLGEFQRKIEILKDEWAGVRIIAISEASSIEDALIIEQGVFYYMSSEDASELNRIIEAAATSLPCAEGDQLQDQVRK